MENAQPGSRQSPSQLLRRFPLQPARPSPLIAKVPSVLLSPCPFFQGYGGNRPQNLKIGV